MTNNAIQPLYIYGKPLENVSISHKKNLYLKRYEIKDVAIFSRCNLGFCKANKPSIKTMDYIEKVRNYLKSDGKSLNDFSQLDLDKVSDICAGIDVFAGWKAKDLVLLTHNLKNIAVVRGCYHKCLHCSLDSPKKVTFMKWDNFTNLVDGLAELKERLGFYPFKNQNQDAINIIYPFMDSDPFAYRNTGLDQKVYGIYDVAEYFYKKTKEKFNLTTAGWEKSDKIAQDSAQKIVDAPECIKALDFSIHPFHGYLEKSRAFHKQGDLEKANFWKEKYIDMIVSNLETAMPLFNKSISRIILEYSADSNSDPCYSFDESAKLLKEIFERINSKHTNSPFDYYRMLEADQIELRPIIYLGRAENLLQRELSFVEKLFYRKKDIKDYSANEIFASDKCITPDGEVLVNLSNIKLELYLASLPIHLSFKHPTNIKFKSLYPQIESTQLLIKTRDDILKRDQKL